MAAANRGRRRYPTWVRVVLVALQAAGVAGGVLLGNATYDAWSEPDEPTAVTTTTTVAPAVPVTEDTLG
ncbi:MAG TPA: hypothetical protein VD926_10070 [Acidimicrobiales bacterium]|nr:hypothetical protein [Acidimicrobiales bacterium]